MLPILLIHGYSTEGKDNTVEKIYGTLPKELKQRFGSGTIKSLNLSRWISLSDGVMLDDVSYAMDRALKQEFPDLLESGFHVIIHSTGALVARNWIKLYSPKPCPIQNLIHLAGANFGSGLAHIGKGQLSRWKNLLSQGTGVGSRILDALEFGSSDTLDIHTHFLKPGEDMYRDYRVQEFNIIGSQTLDALRVVPIRYVKEDSSDNTVRTSATNLNFNYIPVKPKPKAYTMSVKKLKSLVNKRMQNKKISELLYDYDLSFLSTKRQTVPFAIAFETAHFGEEIGIVSGTKNRASVMPLVKAALTTAQTDTAYQKAVEKFNAAKDKTFERAAKLKWRLTEWHPQEQYEGHAQLVFRIRDQFGNGVKHFDVMMNTAKPKKGEQRLEKLIEDHHGNKNSAGIITFYLRTQSFNDDTKTFDDLLGKIAPLDIEITGHEPDSNDIAFVPLNIQLSTQQVQNIIQSFKTTIIDIELVRLPSDGVFKVVRKK
ncbi:hypothetical protein [Aliikangiella coralliicola]|uniref:Alpha/beta hydrolase n=1 Tax=Aliikangiella coralliicola TaxID=2592383 RepID=A0A545UG11_9GAMM|nr:hypothetical protein [Aliikangiella coralliicola]TQV88333.1 hypothetical protein FLL46_07350 [Aliikangiella coralliicola]